MVAMASPYRHPKTGIYYLRRQIPLPLRAEFAGKCLYKESLRTKDAAQARILFPAANARLEERFAGARNAVAERTSRNILSRDHAETILQEVLAPIAGRFPMLLAIWSSEEAARSGLGTRAPALLPSDDRIGTDSDIDSSWLPGDVWMEVARGRCHADLMWMAEGTIDWFCERSRDTIVRTLENDRILVDLMTATVARQLEELRSALRAPRARSSPRPRIRV